MNLHENKINFEEAINRTVAKSGISFEIIEKDYFVTLLLKAIVQKAPETIFKGGTSLSKCYNIINRFSEDIDLNCECNASRPTHKVIKGFNQKVIDVVGSYGYEIVNEKNINTGYRYNNFTINYGKNNNPSIKQHIIIETSMQVGSFPHEMKHASTIIYKYLHNEFENIMKENDMMPFEVKTQVLERTFLDKIFAICDYYLCGKIPNHSRHIYDLYKLSEVVQINSELKSMMIAVRIAREEFTECKSVIGQYDINLLLKKY